jgi:hypothetical protein
LYGDKICDAPFGSFPPSEFKFETVTERVSIESAKSCIFTSFDSYSDGSTSPFEGKPMRFTLKLNGKTEIEYNGFDADAEYEE